MSHMAYRSRQLAGEEPAAGAVSVVADVGRTVFVLTLV
jgi:hypothetical protein